MRFYQHVMTTELVEIRCRDVWHIVMAWHDYSGRHHRQPPAPETKDLPNFPGGFWFGINHRLAIEGSLVFGRHIAAKKLLQRSGEHTPLPVVFHCGGRRRPAVGGKGKRKTGKVWGWRDERIHSVMGLVLMHDGAL